ncbi:hypothetical protein CJF32_00000215 [Rutstroemia sp. NJR-2017a WRK4]|nr:hypothetical protein CJF32_00000215 [Rutstroemia sp. NJR-2017a WRK4]
MADETPSRRSKTPVPSANVPPTPSRIPVPTQSARPFSSFASPTKASLARHNPQLLARAVSTGPDIGASANRGRLQDVFERALGNTPQSGRGRSAGDRPIPGRSNDANNGTPSRTPTRARSVGGGMASQPRRMLRSPAKRPLAAGETPRSNFKPAAAFENIQGIANPFQKKGLRRSPVPGQSSQPLTDSQAEELPEDFNPFKKTGLRRSPPAATPTEIVEPGPAAGIDEEVSTTPKEPPPPQAVSFNAGIPKTTDEIAIRSRALSEPLVSQPSAASPPTESPERAEPVEPSDVIDNNVVEETIPASPIEPPTAVQSEESFDLGTPDAPNELPSTTPKDPVPPAAEAFMADIVRRKSVEEPAQPVDEPQLSEDIVPSSSNNSSPSTRRSQQLSTARSTQRQLFPSAQRSPAQKSPVQKPSARLSAPPSRRRSRPELEEPEEPELPLTPTQRGIADPIVTTPPVGIHSTPSKTARRNKALGQKLKSSPLKQRVEFSSEKESEVEPPAKRRKSARFSIPHDPHAEKKKIRDDLLKELQQLQADVSLANKENERIRLQQEAQKSKPSRPPNPEEILALLRRAVPTEKPESKPPPISALKATSLFLPFSSRRKALQTPLPPLEKPLPSHLPVQLDDPLPYLQAFSPLTYKSTITLLPQSSPESTEDTSPPPTLQHHQISASHPSGLFAARLSMIVDTASLSISSLAIDRLDPNAEFELGPFVHGCATARKDIGTVCWAMARWTEVAVKRARFWCDVEGELGTRERRKEVLGRFRGRKRKRKIDEEEEAKGYKRRDLLTHMGRTGMDIRGEGNIGVRVEWKIGLDWLGDVESCVDVDLDVPGGWYEMDERNSLRKIKDMFAQLVKDKGPLVAVKTVVGLVMGEE